MRSVQTSKVCEYSPMAVTIYIPHNAKKSIHFKHIILFINIWRGFCGSCFPTQSSPVIVYSMVTVHHTTACLISALLLQQLVFHTSIEKSFLLPYKGNTPLNKKLTCPSCGLKTRVLVCYNHVSSFSFNRLVLYKLLFCWERRIQASYFKVLLRKARWDWRRDEKTHLRDSCAICTKFSGNKFLLTWKHRAFLASRRMACRLKRRSRTQEGGVVLLFQGGVLSLTYHLHTIKAPLKPLKGQWVLLIRREATQNWTETKIKTKKKEHAKK